MAGKRNKGANALRIVRTNAKKLMKSRGLSYQDALSRAGAEYRSRHKPKKTVGRVKTKKAKAVKKAPRRAAAKPSSRVSGVGMTAGQHKAAALAILKIRLGNEYVKRDSARLKPAKKKHGKAIVDLKKQIRALE